MQQDTRVAGGTDLVAFARGLADAAHKYVGDRMFDLGRTEGRIEVLSRADEYALRQAADAALHFAVQHGQSAESAALAVIEAYLAARARLEREIPTERSA